MQSTCDQENCTVGETGVCLLNNDAETCPHRIREQEPTDEANIPQSLPPPLETPRKEPVFPPSLSLTPDRVREIMGNRYCRLVGILGVSDAGKTAALVSLYLLLARGWLEGFGYSDSRSLRAFDDLSQGARRWNEGLLPEQLTVHTELADDRSAGFLHLRVRPNGSDRPIDLLLPDLPGEWSRTLIDHQRTDRLEFLNRADVVWLMVDGRQLAEPSQRQWALHRAKLLIRRLAETVETLPLVVLVITRRDQRIVSDADVEELRSDAKTLGVDLEVCMIASFSDDEHVKPGFGIAELIATSVRSPEEPPQFWPEPSESQSGRAMWGFRRPETAS